MGLDLYPPGMGMCVSVPHLEGLAWAEDSDEEAGALAGSSSPNGGGDSDSGGSGGGGGGDDDATNGGGNNGGDVSMPDSHRQDLRRRVKGELSPLRMGNRAVSTSALSQQAGASNSNPPSLPGSSNGSPNRSDEDMVAAEEYSAMMDTSNDSSLLATSPLLF